MLSVEQSPGPLMIHEEELRLPPWERSLCYILRTGGMWEVVWLFRKIHLADPLEEGMATHSRVLAWRIPWTEEPGGLQSTGIQRSPQGCKVSDMTEWLNTHARTPCCLDLARRSLMNTFHSTIIPWTPRFSQDPAQDPDLRFCDALHFVRSSSWLPFKWGSYYHPIFSFTEEELMALEGWRVP